MKRILLPFRKHQRGAAAVEFALVAIIFFMLLIGIVEMGRVLFTWNAAVEATRYGARVAVVCDQTNKAAILSRMQKIMPTLTDENVTVFYGSQQVSVSIQNVPVTTLIPVSAATLMVPPFTTSLPRESMMDAIDGRPNPVCT